VAEPTKAADSCPVKLEIVRCFQSEKEKAEFLEKKIVKAPIHQGIAGTGGDVGCGIVSGGCCEHVAGDPDACILCCKDDPEWNKQ
jgi:hypothetical protein